MRNWLKEIRENKGLTQEQVAILSGISRSHYTSIERGIKTPSVDVAKKISKALKFDWVIFFNNNSSLEERNEQVI